MIGRYSTRTHALGGLRAPGWPARAYDRVAGSFTIGGVAAAHPVEVRNQRVRKVDRESCATVLDAGARRAHLLRGR